MRDAGITISATETRLPQKLLRKKKNESWAMRSASRWPKRFEAVQQVRLSELEETCYAKSSSLVCSGVAQRLSACWRFGVAPKQSFANARDLGAVTVREEKSAIARRARQHARRVRYPIAIRCATRLRARSFATRRKPRRLLRRVKRRWSQSSFQRRVSIFRWINRPRARA